MANKKQGVLQTLTQKIWGKNKAIRDLSSDRLDEQGLEKLDPVPFAIAANLGTTQTIDDRIREIMRRSYVKANPDLGLDSDDPDDFGSDTSEAVDPMYEFERRHAQVEDAQQALDEANAELAAAKRAYQEKRKKEASSAPQTPSKEDKATKVAASEQDDDPALFDD